VPEHPSRNAAPPLPRGVAWGLAFEAVHDLAATAFGLAAAVQIDGAPALVGLDTEGRLGWRTALPGPAVLVAGESSLFAVTDDLCVRVDPADGGVAATQPIDPPSGGRAKGTTLVSGDALVLASGRGLLCLDAAGLRVRWRADPGLDRTDALLQLAANPTRIVAVANRLVTALSAQGRQQWRRALPRGDAPAGSSPLLLDGDRVLIGLVPASAPAERLLQALSLADGRPLFDSAIRDLAMFCPAHVSGGVLVLDTQGGLAGFDLADRLSLLWTLQARVAFGACIAQDGHLVVATRDGALLRVAIADGRARTLLQMPSKTVWVPPAPDLSPGVHTEPAGAIEHLAILPQGVAFSVRWSADHAAIQLRPWSNDRVT